ncbi:hypothetical protein B0H16DRAFT_1456077 [Mycena metata]|uniref:Uncharacterized protein n=1 Tax=Mycena metata TaxID=1033252 RepID=A0AAD7JBK8_9AGAR|nr:hypothetical protein B0H16DRAFT_1456077 [Mycena metata]
MFLARRGAAPSKRRPWRRLKFPIKLYQILIKSTCRECPNYSQHTSNGAFGEMESKRSEDSNSETLSTPDKIWLGSEDNTMWVNTCKKGSIKPRHVYVTHDKVVDGTRRTTLGLHRGGTQ